MGFRTVPDALRAAGRTGDNAVGQLHGADCGQPTSGVATAVPGGRAAGAAASFSDGWARAFSQWCGDAERYSGDLGTAADNYQRGDQAAAASAEDAGRLRGPR